MGSESETFWELEKLLGRNSPPPWVEFAHSPSGPQTTLVCINSSTAIEFSGSKIRPCPIITNFYLVLVALTHSKGCANTKEGKVPTLKSSQSKKSDRKEILERGALFK